MSEAFAVTPCANAPSRTRRIRRAVVLAGLAVATLVAMAAPGPSFVQAPGAAKPVSRVAERGERWAELKPAQQSVLKPLEREWPGMDPRSKQKWLELTARFPKLKPAEQARVQERMADWTRLTPSQRGEARMNYQEAKQLPAQDRQARWKAYEALSAEQKQQLAAKAAPTNDGTRKGNANSARSDGRSDKAGRESGPQAKSNIVPNPAFAAPPRTIGPTVVQARPGATTTLITKRPSPPGHQQTGLPKIAGTPEFVNQATLLPQRGPQGAATRSATVPATPPAPAPR